MHFEQLGSRRIGILTVCCLFLSHKPLKTVYTQPAYIMYHLIQYVQELPLCFLVSSTCPHLYQWGRMHHCALGPSHQQPSLCICLIVISHKQNSSFKAMLQFTSQASDWFIRDGICSGWAPSAAVVVCLCLEVADCIWRLNGLHAVLLSGLLCSRTKKYRSTCSNAVLKPCSCW